MKFTMTHHTFLLLTTGNNMADARTREVGAPHSLVSEIMYGNIYLEKIDLFKGVNLKLSFGLMAMNHWT
jgi:hypothetical protein